MKHWRNKMLDFTIIETGFHKEKIEDNGNKFLIGNGYMGIRGTLEEFTKEQLVAINLAGIYDQVGDGWREPLNAPNALYATFSIDGEAFHIMEKDPIEHELILNYEEAILKRRTLWQTTKGQICLETERFVDMEKPHFLHQKYSVTADYACQLEVYAGIDGDIWDIYGPHYTNIAFSILDKTGNKVRVEASTQNQKETVWVEDIIETSAQIAKILPEPMRILRKIKANLVPDKSFSYTRQIKIYTSKDVKIESESGSYKEERSTHIAYWKKLWETSKVTIEGDDVAMEALNYSLYHLLSIAPRHSSGLSIAARGLSGQTYKGAVFWDTEMFMLDFFLYTQPQVAKSLLKYRIDTLQGAIQKAKDYGYDGAFYAWESQEGGFDACSDYNVTDVFTGRPMRTFFKDKQIHISGAIAYGIMQYVNVSGDKTLLVDGGLKTIIECAKFYYGLLIKKVSSETYELHDVIGPDEYHERVNNNGYTNRIAKFTFETAYKLLADLQELGQEVVNQIKGSYDVDCLKENFLDAAKHLYLPEPDEVGIIEQFDGYKTLEDVSVEDVKKRLLHEKEYWGGAYGVASHTQIIKQADVVTWLTLFSNDFSRKIMKANWQYYEPRTEHGSSLSACMYAWLACLCDMQEKAYPFFIKSAMADLKGGGKQWAGLVYIGGTHPAAAGGAYMTAIHGFAGLTFEDGQIRLNPKFPKSFTRMEFKIAYREALYAIQIQKIENGEYEYSITECEHSLAR